MAMLREIWRNFPRKPATLKYPFERLEPAERFRGKQHFDPNLCVGCGLCARDCPAKAIEWLLLLKVRSSQYSTCTGAFSAVYVRGFAPGTLLK